MVDSLTPEENLAQKRKQGVLSHFPNITFNVVVIAASAGGLHAMKKVLSALPPDFPAAIIVMQHLSPKFPSHTSEILNNCTALWVKQAEKGELLRPGRVYTAIPNQQLLVNPEGRFSFSDVTKVNLLRLAADPLFASLAVTYQTRMIAVVLTGKGTDGLKGVLAIKKHGGMVIAQDEATSKYFSMPEAAISTQQVDFVLDLEEIASTLTSLVMIEKATLVSRISSLN
ncbi:MAG: chemotaxis protein CheB [Cyanobacteria bacterium SW_4_48_29]|nr:MAG: chemotaxis protein CheB [Cyanobacteria bacterium SW_7_48_12]PSP29576.1 MAG: chemotaxis protein CheB [Cyanobacteria bacterium SW_4_48_29]